MYNYKRFVKWQLIGSIQCRTLETPQVELVDQLQKIAGNKYGESGFSCVTPWIFHLLTGHGKNT